MKKVLIVSLFQSFKGYHAYSEMIRGYDTVGRLEIWNILHIANMKMSFVLDGLDKGNDFLGT